MKFSALTAGAGMLLFLIGSVPSDARAAVPLPTHVPQQIIVKYTEQAEWVIFGDHSLVRSNFFTTIANLFRSDATHQEQQIFDEFKELSNSIGIVKQTPLEDSPRYTRAYHTIQLGRMDVEKSLLENLYLVEFSNGDVQGAIAEIEKRSFILLAQPNFVYSQNKTPNDPLIPQQWQHSRVLAPDAWDRQTGSSEVIVAIIDTGVDYTHPDLAANMIAGTDTYQEDDDPLDRDGHGTMVAGAVGAVGNNETGGSGSSWTVSLMPLRTGLHRFDSDNILQSLEYAREHNADIINMSFGADDRYYCDVGAPVVESDALNRLVDDGVFLVASAGNEASNSQCSHPANLPGVLAVSATDRSDNAKFYSNYGPSSWNGSYKILAAPAGFPTTAMGNEYDSPEGTSFSAPYVSGAVALMLSLRPDLKGQAQMIRRHLYETGDDLPQLHFQAAPNPDIPGDNGQYTYGRRLNLGKAINLLADATYLTPTVTPSFTPTPTVPVGAPTNTPAPAVPTPTPVQVGGPGDPPPDPPRGLSTYQVDWTFNGQGKCWSAWGSALCSEQAHEGGASLASRDLNNDGVEDITCSQGDGASHTTTVTNVSDRTYTLRCERYICNSCISGNGTHSQCDGSLDADAGASAIKEEVDITPGCVATCSQQGIWGTCLSQSNPIPTPTPTRSPEQPTPTPQLPTPTPNTPDPVIDIRDVIDTVSETSIVEVLNNLVDDDSIDGPDELQTRYATTEGNDVEADYILATLNSMGVAAQAQTFGKDQVPSVPYCPANPMGNIIGRINGTDPNSVYIVSAHYDSSAADSGTQDPAPGADDNASGVSAVLEIARALKKIESQMKHSVEFILFDAEEQGMCGSTYYVDSLASAKNIQGVINLDMLGFPGAGGDCTWFGYKPYNGGDTLADDIVAVNNQYGIGLITEARETTMNASDHLPFWNADIPAVVGTECWLNTAIHTVDDTTDKLATSQITKAAKAVAGALAIALTTDAQAPTPTPGPQNPTPTPDASQPTPTAPPRSGSTYPFMMAAPNFRPEYSQDTPAFIYGWLTEGSFGGLTSWDQKEQKMLDEINSLKAITAPTTKMIITSSYATTRRLLTKYSQELKNAGVSYIGYNMEGPPVATPEDELNRMLIDAPNNSVVEFASLVTQHGFRSMWGPIRLKVEEGSRSPSVISRMKNAGLTAVAMQEQKPIENPQSTALSRAQAVNAEIAIYRAHAGEQFEVYIQVMSSRCGNHPWTKCKDFMTELQKQPNQINGVGIWASSNPPECRGEPQNGVYPNQCDVANLPLFIDILRQGMLSQARGGVAAAEIQLTNSDAYGETNPAEEPSAPTVQSHMVDLINKKRGEYGHSPLSYDVSLAGMAEYLAVDSSRSGTCTHKASNGLALEGRAVAAGISYAAIGETIACGQNTPDEAVASWWKSPGHHDILTSAEYGKVGVVWISSDDHGKNRAVAVVSD